MKTEHPTFNIQGEGGGSLRIARSIERRAAIAAKHGLVARATLFLDRLAVEWSLARGRIMCGTSRGMGLGE
jgi:hypothetical protein